MSGKRRDYDGNFAVIDVNFILGDPRLDELTSAERWLYITLWCLSVRERRETLPAHYGNKSIARLSRLDTRTVQNGLTKLFHSGLIGSNDYGHITVLGVKSKHKNLKWKCGNINDNIAPQIPAIKKKKERSKKKEEVIKKKEVPIPEWIDSDTWSGFVDMREKVKAPLTERATKLIINELKKLKESGDNPNEVIERSIMNNWKGVFALKKGFDKPKKDYQNIGGKYDNL